MILIYAHLCKNVEGIPHYKFVLPLCSIVIFTCYMICLLPRENDVSRMILRKNAVNKTYYTILLKDILALEEYQLKCRITKVLILTKVKHICILSAGSKMPIQNSNSKISTRPDYATNLLQILIPTTFNSLLCRRDPLLRF